MTIDTALTTFFSSASSIMTLVSFATFLGIVWWSFSSRRSADFAQAALLPFADDIEPLDAQNPQYTQYPQHQQHNTERHHG